MTDTIVSSATKEVVIGFNRPFVIIGERINPTGRKILAAEMAVGVSRTVTRPLASTWTRFRLESAHRLRKRYTPAVNSLLTVVCSGWWGRGRR